MGIGATASIYVLTLKKREFSRKINEYLSITGVLCILFSTFIFNRETPFPSLVSLVPTVGTVLVLVFSKPDTFVGKFLSLKPLVAIGLISYSAYLWHQPVFAFSRYYFSNISPLQVFALIVICLALAGLTWYLVEQPFRVGHFFSKRVVFIFGISGCLIFVLYSFAVDQIFETSEDFSMEADLAQILCSTDIVYFPSLDERKFVQNRIRCEPSNPDVIVLGSSRINQISSEILHTNLINLFVSGASLEDDIAIEFLASKKFQNKTIMIGLDPWLFNSKSSQNRWKSLEREYLDALVDFDQAGSDLTPASKKKTRKKKDSKSLFKKARSLYQFLSKSKIHATNDLPETRYKIRRDGSLVFPIATVSRTQKEIERGFAGLLNYSMKSYQFSNETKKVFERFIKKMKRNSRVIFVLSPYHPGLYEKMKNERPVFLETEQEFRDLAKKNKVEIIGSYDPRKMDCDENDFYDGMHPKASCMTKVLSGLAPKKTERRKSE